LDKLIASTQFITYQLLAGFERLQQVTKASQCLWADQLWCRYEKTFSSSNNIALLYIQERCYTLQCDAY